ncbi:uncharacterized protein LOC124695012 [Lolium rigidum]|uniref:uncharacterized protein LOC124695012 n=1 Tax=Lolium rigidum TaxID=89674 RepID=UPI001F5CD0FB|nr:uncharacterized protein LOC124695012 [Lolium rigidum]
MVPVKDQGELAKDVMKLGAAPHPPLHFPSNRTNREPPGCSNFASQFRGTVAVNRPLRDGAIFDGEHVRGKVFRRFFRRATAHEPENHRRLSSTFWTWLCLIYLLLAAMTNSTRRRSFRDKFRCRQQRPPGRRRDDRSERRRQPLNKSTEKRYTLWSGSPSPAPIVNVALRTALENCRHV